MATLKLELLKYGNTTTVGPMEVPGIGAAAAYASGDAFGTVFAINVPKSGIIQAARMIDKDDEGITTEVWMFKDKFTATADNGAFAPTDADLSNLECVISISTFYDASSNRFGVAEDLGISYAAPSGLLYCQCVTRGAPNIAADNMPMLLFKILSD